jgi:hypothetical protein
MNTDNYSDPQSEVFTKTHESKSLISKVFSALRLNSSTVGSWRW